VRIVCDALNVGSTNLGIGENGLHSEHRNILEVSATGRLHARPLRNSSISALTPSGISVGEVRHPGELHVNASRARRRGLPARIRGAVKAFGEP